MSLYRAGTGGTEYKSATLIATAIENGTTYTFDTDGLYVVYGNAMGSETNITMATTATMIMNGDETGYEYRSYKHMCKAWVLYAKAGNTLVCTDDANYYPVKVNIYRLEG